MMPMQQFFIQDCVEGCKQRVRDSSIDLVFADPPFNIKFGKNASAYVYGVSVNKEIYYKDDMTPEEYESWSRTWIEQAYRVLCQDGVMIIMCPWNWVSMFELVAHQTGFSTLNHVIWRYEFGVFTTRRFVTSHYHYLILLKGDPDTGKWTFNKERAQEEDVEREIRLFFDDLDPEAREKNIVKIANEIEAIFHDKNGKYTTSDFFDDLRRLSKRYTGINHPCKLSEDVLLKFFRIFTNDGNSIVDLFLGSGTSLLAAKMLGRNFTGFEINPAYEQEIKKLVKTRMNVLKNVPEVETL